MLFDFIIDRVGRAGIKNQTFSTGKTLNKTRENENSFSKMNFDEYLLLYVDRIFRQQQIEMIRVVAFLI